MSCRHQWAGAVIKGPVNHILVDQCEKCGKLRLQDAAPPAQGIDLGKLWINVNDRLPTEEDYGDHEDVLVRYRYTDVDYVEWLIGDSRHDVDDQPVRNGGWLFGSCYCAEVSHWMPKSELLRLIDQRDAEPGVGNG